jgi:hypothetical protein
VSRTQHMFDNEFRIPFNFEEWIEFSGRRTLGVKAGHSGGGGSPPPGLSRHYEGRVQRDRRVVTRQLGPSRGVSDN